jgi:ubiquinone/menaquinone biosynthesis C-methylase UbiE
MISRQKKPNMTFSATRVVCLTMNDERTGIYYRLHAWALAKGISKYEEAVANQKRALFGELRGTVLEIGPGSGVNLQYYSTDIRWIGIEPNPFNHPNIQMAADRAGIEIELRSLDDDRLQADDNSIDAVVSTLVLCTVPDQTATLLEILRVLKPGGRFAFIEHVAAPRDSLLRKAQRMIRPAWKWIADGCCPDRETASSIEAAGFSSVEIESFRAPLPRIFSPHIAGVAVK